MRISDEDRELLNSAAKAIGIELIWDASPEAYSPWFIIDGFADIWNPLDNDRDALRMAVKLEIELSSAYDAGMNAYAGYSIDDDMKYVIEPTGEDPYAATRRAIVRAAAEIGKAMKCE